MAILTFSLTGEEFLAGKKTVTRRDWKPAHLARWQRWWDEGRRVHDAWDRSPRAGGRRIGRFRLTCRPYLERLADMPVPDLAAEGGMCATREEFCRLIGKAAGDVMAVVRFEMIQGI